MTGKNLNQATLCIASQHSKWQLDQENRELGQRRLQRTFRKNLKLSSLWRIRRETGPKKKVIFMITLHVEMIGQPIWRYFSQIQWRILWACLLSVDMWRQKM